MQFLVKTFLALCLSLGTSTLFAEDDVLELSTATVSTVNVFLWSAVIVGVIVGIGVHVFMHKKRMSFDVIIPIAPAILTAIIVVYIPYFLSSPNDFGKVCFQNITDSYGQVRESLALAYDCALSREEISAWGIGGFISGFKSIFGYSAADTYLSTGVILFFYYTIVAFWVVILYLLTLWVRKKIKN